MKRRLSFLFSIAVLAAAAAQASDYSFKESFNQAGAFESAGKLTLENINGDIDIDTWDKNEIRIEGVKSARTDEELKLIEVIIDRSASRADIKVKFPKRSGGWFGNNSVRGSVRFKISLPATAHLERVKTVNSSIKIDGVRGLVNAETVNGRLRASSLGGTAHLQSVNGNIDAHFTTLVSQQELSFKTVNGSVDIVLPADAGVQLRTSVVNGHVDCDFPLELQGRVGGKRLSGKIGDGRTSLSAESVNGSIHLKKN